MEEKDIVCGRDVDIIIDGKRLLQAERAELRRTAELHRVRSCFCSEDRAHIECGRGYKLNLTGVRFRRPFENCNFYDLDNFTVRVELDGEAVVLEGCVWDDHLWTADKNQMREHISIVALRAEREVPDEGE